MTITLQGYPPWVFADGAMTPREAAVFAAMTEARVEFETHVQRVDGDTTTVLVAKRRKGRT